MIANPPRFVKTKRDKRLWVEAEKIVAEEYPRIKFGSDRFFALANSIFHRLKYRVGGSNPKISKEQIQRGTEHELEHTTDKAIAKKIALDHLKEDPHYYDKLEDCFNPPEFDKLINQYEKFHGVSPRFIDKFTGWIPGSVCMIGSCVDVGYFVKDKRSNKNGSNYVHDCGSGVNVYSRCKKGNKKFSNFSRSFMVLGHNIGFTLENYGEFEEIKGKRDWDLCVASDECTLVILSNSGVEFVIAGGNLYVSDWIRG